MVLYGRAGCRLCDEGRAVVARVCAETGEPWTEVDVDAPPPAGGRDLFEEYSERVPVVAVDGLEVAQWRVSERALRTVLASGRARA